MWLQSYSSFCKRHGRTKDGRNLDTLVSLHLGGLDKNVVSEKTIQKAT